MKKPFLFISISLSQSEKSCQSLTILGQFFNFLRWEFEHAQRVAQDFKPLSLDLP